MYHNTITALINKKYYFLKEILIMKGEFTQKGKEAMERFKMESANEVGVNLKEGYNGDLTARQAGSIGGQMVKKMIDAYKMQ